MNRDCYPYCVVASDSMYFFVSEGFHGEIEKGVLIERMPDHMCQWFIPTYNLGFGDIVLINGEWVVDDSVRSGNGDMPKVIATVAQIAKDFLRKHAGSTITFQGYIDAKSAQQGKNHRNILYQRGIESNWNELTAEFQFWGVRTGQIEIYIPGRSYDQILVRHQ